MGNAGPWQGHDHHVVRPGDTLSGIARRHGLEWRAVAQMNGVTDPTRLRVGSTLRLPTHGSSSHSVPHAPPPLPPAPKLPAAPVGTAHRRGMRRLGELSMIYETGFRPGQEAQAAGVVSTGIGDPGGVSYGAYQLASSQKGGRQVQAFLRADGARWAHRFGTHNPALANGAFGKIWKEIADENALAFFEVQHAYIARTHFNPVVRYVANVNGVDITTLSPAVQNVVWSMSVQHGRAAKLVASAFQQVGTPQAAPSKEYYGNLINTLYDVRERYVEKNNLSYLKKRYRDERQAALRQLVV